MPVLTECQRCGYSNLTKKEFLYHTVLSCQKCGWSEDYPDPIESRGQLLGDTEKLQPGSRHPHIKELA